MQQGECADGKLWLCCDIQLRCTSTSSSAHNSSLYCFRCPWLHPPAPLWKTCGRSSRALLLPAAEETQINNACMKPCNLNSGSHVQTWNCCGEVKLLMWFELDLTDVIFTQIQPSKGLHEPCHIKIKLGEKGGTNLNVGGVELLLHHLLQNGERWLDSIFQCHGLSVKKGERNKQQLFNPGDLYAFAFL